jgi:hypothetical protein
MLKNYRSGMSVQRIFENLNKVLATHGARQISYDYDGLGKATGLSFSIQTPRGMRTIRVPTRVERVAEVLKRQRAEGWTKPDQAYRTAWKNIHDWVVAQMALLDTEMVKLEEIFLPYMVDASGQTFYEAIERRGYSLGPSEAREEDHG